MGYTDAHGRPEIEPGDWFGTSAARLRRNSPTAPAPTAKPDESEVAVPNPVTRAQQPTTSTGTPERASSRLRRPH